MAATAGGLLASDSTLYGPGTVRIATEFIVQALKLHQNNFTVHDIIRRQRHRTKTSAIPGYGRPLARGDERVTAMLVVADKLGFSDGPHLKLAKTIEAYLMDECGESMNLAGYIMPFLSDQDWNAHEINALYSICVEAGLLACYQEAAGRPADSFLPLRCDDIDYQGPPLRSLEP